MLTYQKFALNVFSVAAIGASAGCAMQSLNNGVFEEPDSIKSRLELCIMAKKSNSKLTESQRNSFFRWCNHLNWSPSWARENEYTDGSIRAKIALVGYYYMYSNGTKFENLDFTPKGEREAEKIALTAYGGIWGEGNSKNSSVASKPTASSVNAKKICQQYIKKMKNIKSKLVSARNTDEITRIFQEQQSFHNRISRKLSLGLKDNDTRFMQELILKCSDNGIYINGLTREDIESIDYR